MARRAHIVVLGVVTSCGGTSTSTIDAHSSTTKAGSVTMSSLDAAAIARAGFGDAPACPPANTVGPCVVSSCTEPPTTTLYSAGTVAIAGTMIPISMSPGADNSYLFETEGAIFLGGSSLTVSAAGAQVPAFTASVTTPSPATITSPAPPAQPLAITRSDGFTFSWTGDTIGSVGVVISEGQGRPQLDCRFEAAAGTATVPPAALMMLPASSQASLQFEAVNATDVAAGDWAVMVSATYVVHWPDGTPAGASATLQ